jgi:hypothetical protein
MKFKTFALCFIIFMLILFFYTGKRYQGLHHRESFELPPLSERVPERLKQKALE